MQPPINSPGAATVAAPDPSETTQQPAAAVVATPARKDWGAWVKQNWMMLAAGVVALFMVGLYFWVKTSMAEYADSDPTVAGSTEHIAEVMSNEVVMPTPADKTASYDEQQQQDERASYQPAQVTPDELAAQQNRMLGLDSLETRKRHKAQQQQVRQEFAAAAHKRNLDTVVVTARDPQSGQYHQQQRVVRRSETTSRGFVGSPESSRSASVRQVAAPRRPLRDRDGAVYETNDEVNMMLREGGPDVQKAYERMTGRRYRPLDQEMALAANSRDAMQYVPGLDGFYTVKYRGRNASPADEADNIPVADVYYRAVISGTQQLRTGSVVTLRFDEDATLQGVSFPRNQLFAALATVETNRVTLQIARIGPYRIPAQVFDYNYMAGIMIDPSKRPPTNSNNSLGQTAMNSGFSDLSSSIDRSQSGANSAAGIAGRMGVTMLQRLPQRGKKLREVTLPDGYPVLITVADATGGRQSQPTRSTGPNGQAGNPLQSAFMSGTGIGGYAGQEQGNR